MLRSFEYPDLKYVQEIVHGLNVAGPVRPSGIWPLETDPDKSGNPKYTIEQILDRAWEYRSKIRKREVTKASQTIYDDTIEEIEMGHCEGIYVALPSTAAVS